VSSFCFTENKVSGSWKPVNLAF